MIKAPPMPDHTAREVAALERAVEEAWQNYSPIVNPDGLPALYHAVTAWLIARRAAREAGMVPVPVSREAVEAFRKWTLRPRRSAGLHAAYRFCLEIDPFLAPLLKPDAVIP